MWILLPLHFIGRGLGGLFISGALIAIAFKQEYRNMAPVVRAALKLGAVIVIVMVYVLLSPLNNNMIFYP
jgi:Ni/Fe-hydrogenase subunit HybB-like protein